MKNKLVFVFLLITLLISSCGSSSGMLTIQDVWARPANTGENGAAYFIIKNGTATDDILLSANSEIASATEVHRSMLMDGDVMTMQMQESVSVPAHEEVALEPGGLHVMFIRLTRDLKIGDTFILTLKFENAGEITLPVEVKEQP